MPPKTSNTLTEAELRLMKILWARGESTVADLVTATNEEVQLAYTSVLTTIRVLEKKGYVVHRQEGRAFLYSPRVAEHDASHRKSVMYSTVSLATRENGCCSRCWAMAKSHRKN